MNCRSLRTSLGITRREHAVIPATALHGTAALPFVIPSEAEGSAVRADLSCEMFFDRPQRWTDLLFLFSTLSQKHNLVYSEAVGKDSVWRWTLASTSGTVPSLTATSVGWPCSTKR